MQDLYYKNESGAPYTNIFKMRLWLWISNVNHDFIWDVISHASIKISIAGEVRVWMSYNIPLVYMDVITYPHPNPDDGLADIS